MLSRVKGSDSSKIGELCMFDEKDPITWKFFLLVYLAQFVGSFDVVEIPIPENESKNHYTERIRQYKKISGRLTNQAARIPSVKIYYADS